MKELLHPKSCAVVRPFSDEEDSQPKLEDTCDSNLEDIFSRPE